jgi:hypothetical protein
MVRAVNSYENAMIESFFKTCKYEEAYLYEHKTLEDVLERLPYFIAEVRRELGFLVQMALVCDCCGALVGAFYRLFFPAISLIFLFSSSRRIRCNFSTNMDVTSLSTIGCCSWGSFSRSKSHSIPSFFE